MSKAMTDEELKELNAAVVEKVKNVREGVSNDDSSDEKFEEIWKAMEVFESIKTRSGAPITRGLMNCASFGGRILTLEAPAKTVRHVGYVPVAGTAPLGGKSSLFRAIPTAFLYAYWSPISQTYYVGKLVNQWQVQAGQQYECIVDAIERMAEIVGET